MNIKIKKSAIKDLQKISSPLKQNIEKKILELKNFPHTSNIKKLTNYYPPFRLRIGNYRVLFNIENENIVIYRVLHRKESYK